jgi:hypothetical protein
MVRKTHRRKTHRRKTHRRRTHRRRTHRRRTGKRGGGVDICSSLRSEFESLKTRVPEMTLNTYESVWNDSSYLRKTAHRLGCSDLVKEIMVFEQKELKNKTNAIHRV